MGGKPDNAVLSDAQALLSSYCIGGDGFHAVIELGFTSSINFLLPGMLLKVSIRLNAYSIMYVEKR